MCWNPSDFVYHPEFDLGIREKWLPKHPVARMNTSIDVLSQDNSTNDGDAVFWQSIGANEDDKLIEVNTDKQLVSYPLQEVSSGPEPKQSKTSSISQSKACGVDGKPTKVSLSLKKPYRHSHQEPWSNGPLKDSTNSSTLLQQRLQRFSKPVSLPEWEKAGKGVVPDNTDASTQWALRNFNIEWAGNRCSLVPDDYVPKDLRIGKP